MRSLLCGTKLLMTKYKRAKQLTLMLYFHSEHVDNELLSSECYGSAYPKLVELTHKLKYVDQNEGKLINIGDNSIIIDGSIISEMETFKSLARAYVGSHSLQQMLQKAASSTQLVPDACFDKQKGREPLVIASITEICDVLDISAQQRKLVRQTICPHITQHHIWRGTLEALLEKLKSDIGAFGYHPMSTRVQMGEQIVSTCLQFLADTMGSSNPDSCSWMRLASNKKADSMPSRRWLDLLEMFDDLLICLRDEKSYAYYLSKIDVMREGLYQIKDVLVDRDMGYKEVRHQEYLVQKTLTKNFGLSSRCLFILLLYYMYGAIVDIEIEVCRRVYGKGNSFCLCIGKFLTSEDEKMVWRGVKKLDNALQIFKFVWQTAGMKGVLKLQGHIWCLRAKERTFTYKENEFFVHGI